MGSLSSLVDRAKTRTLSSRVAGTVVYACIVFALAVVGIGAVGIVAVRSATATAVGLSADELATSTETAALGQAVSAAYSTGQALAFRPEPKLRAQRIAALYDTQLPAVEADLTMLSRLHGADDPAELADRAELVDQWAAVRTLLNPTTVGSATVPDATRADALESAYIPLRAHISNLIAREASDGAAVRAEAAATDSRSVRRILATMLLAMVIVSALGWVANRRMQRAIEPTQDRAEFTDALQLAEDEDEAHRLLQRHLERLVEHGVVTVLKSNDSTDRLDAVSALLPGSPLIESLAHARPGSCLAVRSARVHDEDDDRRTLLSCPVCGDCPGRSTCTPLTVGGEVIGSVLLTRPRRFAAVERQRVRDSVGQAAPVLANLRNLAIAELRAATDSLTGLPNKRAVDDTMKRMLAQASRTLTPLSLLVLDLDHFKDINDRFGHPVGDEALANVGAAIRSALRESDFAGRAGGEEFAVMLPDTALDGAIVAADKIRTAIAAIVLTDIDVTMTASVGIAAYPDHATGTERLERLADSALYVAKRRGRDRIEIAEPQEEPLDRS